MISQKSREMEELQERLAQKRAHELDDQAEGTFDSLIGDLSKKRGLNDMKAWDDAFASLPKTKKAKRFHTAYTTRISEALEVHATFKASQKRWKKTFKDVKASMTEDCGAYFNKSYIKVKATKKATPAKVD